VEAETYTVSTVTPAVVDKKDIATTDIVIAGTNFGTDKTKFVVMLGTETATIKTVTTTAITVNIDATQAARIMGTAQTLTIKRTVTGQTATIDRTKAGAFTVTPPAIASIAVTPATVTLVKDSTQQFVATATYDDTTTAVVTATATWAATSGTMSATTKGLYTAPAAEATGISVTATVGTIVGTSTVTVISSPLVSLAVTGAANATKVGQALTLQMTANGTHEDTVVRTATDVTWASTDTTVATISATGLITGLTAGTTNITATKGTIVSPAVTITVEALDSILIATTTASIKMTETATFTAVGSYATLGNVDVAAIATFAVATATNGTGTAALNVVTPTNPGTANVTATIGTVTSNTVLVTIDADPGIANVTFVRTGATTATLAWTTSYDVTSGLAYYSGLGSLGTGVDPISMKTLQETATATKTHTLSLTDIDATATADVTDPSKAGWRIKVGYTINGTLYESDLKLLTETN
jgi:hypothetical protein